MSDLLWRTIVTQVPIHLLPRLAERQREDPLLRAGDPKDES